MKITGLFSFLIYFSMSCYEESAETEDTEMSNCSSKCRLYYTAVMNVKKH
jgi:hypothetical protein